MDAQLVSQARVGSQDAFAQLYQAYLPLLFYFIRKHLRSEEDAADVVQETFVYALVKLDDLKDPAAFRPWLFRIGLSKAIDATRSGTRHEQDVALDAPDFDEGATLTSLSLASTLPEGAPEEAQEQQEERTELLGYLKQLTPVQKDTLILRYYAGLSSVAVAEMLGLTPGAVRKRLHDAGVALRELVQGTPVAEELLASGSDSEKEAAEPLDAAGQALVARLLAEDGPVDREASEKAERLVSPKVSVALSALIAGGGLDATALTRTQAFLSSINKGLPVPPPATVTVPKSAPATSQASKRLQFAGRTAMIGIGAALVYALIGGGLALWRAVSNPSPGGRQIVATTTSQGQSQAATATTQDATPTAQTQTTVAQSGTQTSPSAASGADRTPATLSTPAQMSPLSPTQLPTISIAQSTLPYPKKANITANTLIVDSQASARAADGTKLTVEVTGLSNINVDHAGNYLVFLNAQDAQGNKALPKILHVVIGQ